MMDASQAQDVFAGIPLDPRLQAGGLVSPIVRTRPDQLFPTGIGYGTGQASLASTVHLNESHGVQSVASCTSIAGSESLSQNDYVMYMRAVLHKMSSHIEKRGIGEMLTDGDRKTLDHLFARPCPKVFRTTYTINRGKTDTKSATTREWKAFMTILGNCLLYTSPSPRDS